MGQKGKSKYRTVKASMTEDIDNEYDFGMDDTHSDTPTHTLSPSLKEEGKIKIEAKDLEHNMGIDTLHVVLPTPLSVVDSLISMEEIPNANGRATAKSLSSSRKLVASTW